MKRCLKRGRCPRGLVVQSAHQPQEAREFPDVRVHLAVHAVDQALFAYFAVLRHYLFALRGGAVEHFLAHLVAQRQPGRKYSDSAGAQCDAPADRSAGYIAANCSTGALTTADSPTNSPADSPADNPTDSPAAADGPAAADSPAAANSSATADSGAGP